MLADEAAKVLKSIETSLSYVPGRDCLRVIMPNHDRKLSESQLRAFVAFGADNFYSQNNRDMQGNPSTFIDIRVPDPAKLKSLASQVNFRGSSDLINSRAP